jgi:hypothetical protein
MFAHPGECHRNHLHALKILHHQYFQRSGVLHFLLKQYQIQHLRSAELLRRFYITEQVA